MGETDTSGLLLTLPEIFVYVCELKIKSNPFNCSAHMVAAGHMWLFSHLIKIKYKLKTQFLNHIGHILFYFF